MCGGFFSLSTKKLNLENSICIDEKNGDIFDELNKVKKTYDIITCSKMNLNDFDYYMLLSRCVKLLENGGIFLFDSSGCTDEFIKKNNYKIFIFKYYSRGLQCLNLLAQLRVACYHVAKFLRFHPLIRLLLVVHHSKQ